MMTINVSVLPLVNSRKLKIRFRDATDLIFKGTKYSLLTFYCTNVVTASFHSVQKHNLRESTDKVKSEP